MILAYAVAGFGFAAMVLYAIRVGNLYPDSGWPDRIMRFAIVALLGFLGLAFLDVAQREGTLLLRQWPVFICLVVIAAAGAWPRDPR